METLYCTLNIQFLTSEAMANNLMLFFILTSLALLFLLNRCRIARKKDEIRWKSAMKELNNNNEKLEQMIKDNNSYQTFCLEILDNLPFPVLVKDIDNDFKYMLWNKEAEQQSGTNQKETLGYTDFDIYGAERGRKYRNVDEMLVKSGENYHVEEDFSTPDGIIHNTIVHKLIVAHGDKHWLLIVRWEITQMKEYERKLILAKEEVENAVKNQNLVLNSINFGLVYIDKNYNVQWESTTNLSKIAKGRRYIPGRICYETVKTQDYPCVNCALSEAITTGLPVRHELSEGEVTIEISAIPVYNSTNTEMLGGLMKIEDVSDKKRIEHLLYEVKKADEANKLKSAFLANMSHEIRTPLNAIVGFSNLLAETEDANEKQEFVHLINTNNDLLLQLINDIIDMAKIESGTLDFVYSDVEINELMNNLLLQMQLKNKQKTVTIEFSPKQPQCIISTDRYRVMQILINLISNAIKFTPKGSITFGYQLDEPANEIYFFVKDTGNGIPSNKINKIFDRFVKLNAFAQGTGLGLPICAMIVDRFGGTIGVESKEGVGSLFWFRLPVCKH